MSEMITIRLTEELQAAMLRYLELRNEISPEDFWTMPLEGARRDVGMAFLVAVELPTDIHVDDDELELFPARRSVRKTIPFIVRARVVARDNFKCAKCGTEHFLTIDHIVPVAKGGTNNESNLQTLCAICNSRKGARMEDV